MPKAQSIQDAYLVREVVPLDQLKPHPKNYQKHPDDEIEHIMESIREHGVYRNVVIARDNTLLAGHGVTEAARRLGLKEIPVVRKDYDPFEPRALKILAGDNEIRHLAEVDDRALSELLKKIDEETGDLLGTGYDELMLANLVMVTRPSSEIKDFDAAAQWAGLPEYDAEGKDKKLQIIVNFASEDDRHAFCAKLGLDITKIPTEGAEKSIWWPAQPKRRHDVVALRFQEGGATE